jgi:hypothetical protein
VIPLLALATLVLSAESDFGDDYDKKLVLLGHYDLLFERRKIDLAAAVLTQEIVRKVDRVLVQRLISSFQSTWEIPLGPLERDGITITLRAQLDDNTVQSMQAGWRPAPSEVGPPSLLQVRVRSAIDPHQELCSRTRKLGTLEVPARFEQAEYRKIDAKLLFVRVKKLFEKLDEELERLSYLKAHPEDTKVRAKHLLQHMDRYDRFQDEDDLYWIRACEIRDTLKSVSLENPFRELFEEWVMFIEEFEGTPDQDRAVTLWKKTLQAFKRETA